MEARKDHQLGILFVHGIGEQPEGETLLAFGDPVIEWLKRWLRRNPLHPGGVEVVEAVLTPSRLSSQDPPHATLRIDPAQQSWLIAESWWGGDVKAPPFGKLAFWMVTVGAWSVLSHVSKGLLRHTNRSIRFAAQVGAFLKWLFWSGLLQVIVVVLAAFALLPIPALRRSLSGVLIALTGVLGDSYVLLESDLQRSAIVNKTRAALDWLCSRCDQVIVVAHSQGAAVAYYALQDPRPANVHTLLTFGSGLNKLEELRRLQDGSASIPTVARLSPVLLALLALIVRVAFFEGWSGRAQISVFFLGLMVLGSAVFVIASARAHWKKVEEWAQSLRFGASRQRMVWLDIHASHDPVPNGVVSPLGTPVADVEHQVVNLRSMFSDHTAYWSNRVQFVPVVVRAAGVAAGINFFPPDARLALSRAARDHERTVRWRAVLTGATWMSLFLLVAVWWRELQTFGAAIAGALHAIGGLFDRIPGMVQALVAWVRPMPEAELSLATLRTLAVAAFAGLIFVWLKGYQVLWRWWDDRALERVYRPAYLAHVVDRAIVNGMVVAAGLVPLILVAGWPVLRQVVVGDLIAGAVFVVYSGFLIFLVGRVFGAAFEAWPKLRSWDRGAWNDVGSQMLTVAFFAGLVGGMLLPDVFPQFAFLKDWTLFAFMAAAFAAMIVGLQGSVNKHARAITHLGSRVVVLSLPVLVMAALVFVSWLEVRDDPIPMSAIDMAYRLTSISAVAYLLALGALTVVLGAVGRRRRKQT